MAIGFVFSKYGPVNVVYDFEYMQPICAMASFGKPRSNMIARSRAWSMDPKAFVKSMNNRYISYVMKCASSSAATRVWIRLLIHLSYQKPS
jgi:hypothetical protein